MERYSRLTERPATFFTDRLLIDGYKVSVPWQELPNIVYELCCQNMATLEIIEPADGPGDVCSVDCRQSHHTFDGIYVIGLLLSSKSTPTNK